MVENQVRARDQADGQFGEIDGTRLGAKTLRRARFALRCRAPAVWTSSVLFCGDQSVDHQDRDVCTRSVELGGQTDGGFKPAKTDCEGPSYTRRDLGDVALALSMVAPRRAVTSC